MRNHDRQHEGNNAVSLHTIFCGTVAPEIGPVQGMAVLQCGEETGVRGSPSQMRCGPAGMKSGASAAAIRSHYDVGNEFYRLWLDDNMTYSCAIWEQESDTLESAQDRKLEYHIQAARAAGRPNVLEIGCGWGGLLNKLVNQHRCEHAVGLTLSQAQADWVNRMNMPNVEVRVESWQDHSPTNTYDAIVSIAATAHFLRPENSENERIAIMRQFFSRCHAWLDSGGYVSLESIVYGTGRYIPESPLSGVFPESDMPRLHELASGFDGLFEPESVINHRVHYPPTLRCWSENLRRNRDEAVKVAGEAVVQAYERYLRAGIKGHESGVFLLLRYTLRKL